MNKRVLFFLIKVPFWISALAFVYSVGLERYFNDARFSDDFGFWASYSLVMLLLVSIPFYVFYLRLVPKYLLQGKTKTFFWYGSLYVLILGPLLILFLGEVHQYLRTGKLAIKMYIEYPDMILPTYVFWMIFSLTPAFLGIIARLAYVSFSNFEKARELENRNLQQEIQMIKSKLNPHLFFNTLNNIDTLIKSNPEKASSMLAKLSDLLRYVVYQTDEDFIPISTEVENLERYIELEKIRLQNPENVSFSAKIIGDTQIPPMIFFPFVENGFKHSNLNLPDQILQIELFQDDTKIRFNCVNTVVAKQTGHESGGVGLELATKRLEMLFPQKHKLEINQTKDKFSVVLEILTR